MIRALDFTTLRLAPGSHEDEDHEAAERHMCIMEAVAYVAGEPWSDHPQCASPVIAAFCRRWNDTDEPYGQAIRDRLRDYIPRLVGSLGTDEQEGRRAWLATDWLIRACAPAWLRLAGLTEHADTLAALPPQVSVEAVQASAAARDAAWAAASAAAWDAVWDAVWDAASAAAWAAAWDAARDVTRAAASAAAWDAASAAARAAARDALQPTVETLQRSAWALLDAMLAM